MNSTKLNKQGSKEILEVTYQHVVKSFEQLYTSKNVKLLGLLRKYEIVAVLAVMVEKSKNPLGKAPADKLYNQFINMSYHKDSNQFEMLSEIEFKEILLRLLSFGVIKFANEGHISYIDLGVYEDEIHAAYQEHPAFKLNERVATNVIDKANDQ